MLLRNWISALFFTCSTDNSFKLPSVKHHNALSISLRVHIMRFCNQNRLTRKHTTIVHFTTRANKSNLLFQLWWYGLGYFDHICIFEGRFSCRCKFFQNKPLGVEVSVASDRRGKPRIERQPQRKMSDTAWCGAFSNF